MVAVVFLLTAAAYQRYVAQRVLNFVCCFGAGEELVGVGEQVMDCDLSHVALPGLGARCGSAVSTVYGLAQAASLSALAVFFSI